MLEYLVRNDLLPDYLSAYRLLAGCNYPFPWVIREQPNDVITNTLHCRGGECLQPVTMAYSRKGRYYVLTVAGEEYLLAHTPQPTHRSLQQALPFYLNYA
jgi:hypothetical protein